MFSLVCALPSPASAEACASLFDWFTGTTAQSDFSGTCMSAVWFMAFADRSCSFEQDVREISRFSCMLFLSVRGFSDYAGPNSHSRNSVAAVLPSSISEGSRHPDPSAFRSSIARPTGTSGLRFTRHLTVPPARLEARMESLFSFPVGLFHPLQHAGLSRRTPDCPQSWNHLAHGTSERDVLLRRPVRIRAWHPLPDTLQNQEKEIIEAALAESRGKVAGPQGAAAKLGIPRSTLDSKIKQLKIKKHKLISEQ